MAFGLVSTLRVVRTAAVAFIGHVLSGERVSSERSLRKVLLSWLVRCSQHSCRWEGCRQILRNFGGGFVDTNSYD